MVRKKGVTKPKASTSKKVAKRVQDKKAEVPQPQINNQKQVVRVSKLVFMAFV